MTGFDGHSGVALVLGGNGGLGSAIVDLLRERGSKVVSTFRTTPRPDGTGHDQLGQYQLDLADAEACERVVEQVVGEHGAIHTLVYAAGPHVPMTHLSKVEPGQFDAQLAGDTGAFFRAVRPALTHLRESAGSIVAVTTAATTRFPVRDGLSAAPKAAIEALVRALAAEEGRYGVRVNCVGPGMLADGMAERLISSGELDERALDVARANIPLHRFGTAADIAEAVCFLASDAAGFITGQKLDVDGGYGV